jgi:hypothetical protein
MTENNWNPLLEVIRWRAIKNPEPFVFKPDTKIFFSGSVAPSRDGGQERYWNLGRPT